MVLPTSVAIQGIAGSFSAAAAARLAPGLPLLACHDFEAVFQALASGQAERAVVPVENTLVGPIAAVEDLLRRQPVEQLGEFWLAIEQCLIVRPRARIEGIRRVLSHPVALAQCTRFLAEHPNWISEAYFDTAGSVREMMERGSEETASIAGPRAAEVYGARLAVRGIGDREDNRTRFLLLAAIP